MEVHSEPSSSCSKAFRGRQRTPRLDALLVGALSLVFGVFVGRQTRDSDSTDPALTAVGFDTMRWSLGGSGSAQSFPQWVVRLPGRTAPILYYLPAELGVHHYTLSGAA